MNRLIYVEPDEKHDRLQKKGVGKNSHESVP